MRFKLFLFVLFLAMGVFSDRTVWAEGTEPLFNYGDSATNAIPQDLDADASEVVVLKYLATPGEFRLERRDRAGGLTSPEILFPAAISIEGGRIALGVGGDAFVLGSDPLQPTVLELRRVTPFELPTTIASYDSMPGFGPLPIDIAASGTGEVVVLKRSPRRSASTHRDREVGIRFPIPGSSGPVGGQGVGAGAAADYFFLSDTFIDVDQNMQFFNRARVGDLTVHSPEELFEGVSQVCAEGSSGQRQV